MGNIIFQRIGIFFLLFSYLFSFENIVLAATYEERWVHGQLFFIGTDNDLQIWVSVEKKKEIQTMVYLINASEKFITFAPESIIIDAVKDHKGEIRRERMKTFSATEYEKKFRRRQGWKAGLAGLFSSGGNQPQPETTSFSGEYSGYENGDSYYGTFSGNITTWPTSRDYEDADARDQARIQAMNDQLQRAFSKMANNLFRTHTLLPKTYIGGMVYIKNKSAEFYEMTIPFGGKEFKIKFDFKEK